MSYLTQTAGAAPATPVAGKASAYSATGGRPRVIAADGSDFGLSGQPFFNFLRNSGFWFAQRQAPATLTTYSSVGGRAITADAWGVSNENASIQFRRVDSSGAVETGLQSRHYGEFTKITATGKIQVMQAIEGGIACQFRGRKVRVQMRLKGIVAGGQWNLALVQLNAAGTIDTIPNGAGLFFTAQGANGVDPTLGANLAYIAPTAGKTGDNCTAGTNSYACTVTTAWQRFGGIFTVPIDAKNLVVVLYSHNQVTATNGIGITEALFVDDEAIQEWKLTGIPLEMARVERFYFKTFNIDTLPAQNVGLNTGEFKFMSTVIGGLAMAGIGFTYRSRMFKAGTTLTLYNPSAANAMVRNVTDSSDTTLSTITANGEQGCWLSSTGAVGNAAGEHMAVHISVDAEL